jgi:hypothetical protein
MLCRINIAAALLLCAVAFLVYWVEIRSEEKDREKYAQLVAESKSLLSSKKIDVQEARQKRTGVQKDIWTAERSHVQLLCSESELAIMKKKKKFEAVEFLHDLECYSQETVDREKNAQEIRVIKADEGTYFFPAHRFVAGEVDLNLYRMDGIELVKPTGTPYLRGRAYDVTGSAEDQRIEFTAYHLRAEVLP